MNRGFSLIELVMTLMILGIITAIAAPRFAGASDGYKLSAGQTQLEAKINLWASRAQRMSRFHTIHFDKSAEIIYLYDGEVTTPADAVDSMDLGVAPYGIDLYRTSLNAAGELVLNGDGFFEEDAAIQLVKGDLGVTISFSGGSRGLPDVVPDLPVDIVDLPDTAAAAADAAAAAAKVIGP
ncbi:MAG: prepilin-type N-terminal cleavage/methylation domain-containing protein [Phycisphaerales bacterium]|nr:prepilin-type N-terminal cleavage/methylation domain-containing protein [Phycisphaerales bacterium]